VLDSKFVEEITPASDQQTLDLDLDFFSGPGLDGFEGVEFPGLGMGLGNSGSGNLTDAAVDWGALGQWNAFGGPV
jgi:hypothetical protein